MSWTTRSATRQRARVLTAPRLAATVLSVTALAVSILCVSLTAGCSKKSRRSALDRSAGERETKVNPDSAPSTEPTRAAPDTRSLLQSPRERAGAFAHRLGKEHFLVGLGNDLADNHDQDGAYVLGPQLDVHYAYLAGLGGRGGWPDWNPGGGFVTILVESARQHSVIPMFTLYGLAAEGENNMKVLTSSAFMKQYWADVRLLFRRLGELGGHVLVHVEPDFWGFAQKAAPDPLDLEVQVEEHTPECSGVGNHVAGMGHCFLKMARKYAPSTFLGFHASLWAHRDPRVVAMYLVDVGARDADFVGIETLDRDAGCYESGQDPSCARRDGPWYWDETNQKSPNFSEHLAAAREIAEGVRRPLLWWQMPFGVPSEQPGGKPGAYRDNKVKYLFEHVEEFLDAGGAGALFGVGAAHQTYITTDGGQFKRAVKNYRKHPVPFRKP